jgi:hypothetical protein
VSETIVIARRFRGPEDSANGGYACARIAELLAWDAEVTLRSPPPLETSLTVERDDRDRVRVLTDGRLVAEAERCALEVDVPAAVSYEEARRASAAYLDDKPHPFPTCFVCGPDRAPGDGMRLRPGALGDGSIAAPWRPSETQLGPEFVWAALDCPGAFAVNPERARGLSVLGRFAARVLAAPAAGDPCTVVGRSLGAEGRKLLAATAVYREGELLGYARATWIVLGT